MTEAKGAGPANGRTRHRRIVGRICVGGAVGVLLVAGCGSPSTEPTYGSLPTYLPSVSFEPDSVLIGTAARPALTTEGDTVQVKLTGASVQMMVAGPEVPGEGLPYQPGATTCTWRVTLAGATAPVPIAVADFTASDHLGAVYRPGLVPGQPLPPATIKPGQSVTFELRAVMEVGEGLMRWAPQSHHVLASWDFEVEND